MNEPITLKTLPQATAQEVFDQVALHLLKQGKPARSSDPSRPNYCSYRTEDRLKCAAGCLIGDDEYNPDWDVRNRTWYDLTGLSGVPLTHRDLIDALQCVHDAYKVPETFAADVWHRLHEVAAGYYLSTTVLNS